MPLRGLHQDTLLKTKAIVLIKRHEREREREEWEMGHKLTLVKLSLAG